MQDKITPKVLSYPTLAVTDLAANKVSVLDKDILISNWKLNWAAEDEDNWSYWIRPGFTYDYESYVNTFEWSSW